MLGASFLPARLRGQPAANGSPSKPGWLNRQITPLLQSLSSRACTHPIHTLVFIALFASTTYIGLLEGSLFESTVDNDHPLGRAEWGSLVEGSKTMRVGQDTNWKWQVQESSDEINAVGVRMTSSDAPVAYILL